MKLTPSEMLRAGTVGLMRQIESIESDRTPYFPEQYPNQMFATHVVGAMAELYVAKFLDIAWIGHVNHFGKPDLIIIKERNGLPPIKVEIEVRYTPDRNDIKVRPKDDDERIVIGVNGRPPEFNILGYVRASTIKVSWPATSPAKGSPAHFAPPEAHTPIEKLKNWISQ